MDPYEPDYNFGRNILSGLGMDEERARRLILGGWTDGPRTHQRAGITKNKRRGESKQRRQMAKRSRRMNRSR